LRARTKLSGTAVRGLLAAPVGALWQTEERPACFTLWAKNGVWKRVCAELIKAPLVRVSPSRPRAEEGAKSAIGAFPRRFRRFATRYDGRTVYFLAFTFLAAVMLWLR
jgi:transposase